MQGKKEEEASGSLIRLENIASNGVKDTVLSALSEKKAFKSKDVSIRLTVQ